ncbi:murein L,D-transpeptidase YcbB/YkuD [Paenochrobactrum gallinarii]|uniref:Murein L,D-transpeptidase YcbB/YkuD n=2 Tax=Paenochrobactrum gallinarii TaxID=643673 RepID=A0A841M1U6_9HYPH|nr:L,D-transpeptidase family protein [Paenochrobactrum gallinarii]MBB6260118.1 murein L,D-transpeptidase YcbB/YkuD [Paenochrobactrum gallinarii]
MMKNYSRQKIYLKQSVTKAGLLAGVIVGASLAASQVQAASTLMELFQKKKAPAVETVQPASQAPVAKAARPATPTAAPVKAVKVSGPQVYDYRADKLVRIDFSKIDEPVTSAAADVALVAPASEVETDATPVAEDKLYSELKSYFATTRIMAEKPIAEAVADFYIKQQRLLWVDENGATARAEKLLAFFDNADEDGLNPKDYAVEEIGLTVEDGEEKRLQKLLNFELMMSARALRYAIDAGEGRIVANRLSGYHDLPRGRVLPAEVLAALSDQADAADYLANFQPQSKWYQALKTELGKLTPESQEIRIASDVLIKPGQENSELRNVIAVLLKKGPASYLNSHQEILLQYAQSDKYEPELVAAIKDYQSLTGNTPDGVIGRSTVAALQGELTSVKRDRLIYSMERLRWLPHEFGDRYAFINQPAYRAYFYDKGEETQAMNIVIGSRANQTYFFYNKIQTVVFNPSWGVPRSIIVNEMLPKIMRDSSYLSRNGYEVYKDGKVVPASSINWSSVAAGKTHVGIRQKPSLDNSLGELKILFPNSHDIYMHDTPAKSYFKRDMRALSHGCIRLERPRDMAAAVLGKSAEDLKPYFGKNERGIKVPEPMPVYVAYFTAWLDEASGHIRYYDDVYGRDEGLEKAFNKTSASRQDVSA